MSEDSVRAEHPLKAVHVACDDDGDEYYRSGYEGITDIQWGWTHGSITAMLTVKVFVDGNLSSEHPFINVLGVEYAP